MFKTRSYKKELLDQEEIPIQDLYQNLKELHTINKLLGGYKTIHTGIKYFSQKKQIPDSPLSVDLATLRPRAMHCGEKKPSPYSILDIGSGGGDTLKFIYKKKYPYIGTLTGVDIKPDCIHYARENCKGTPISFIESDYKKVIENPEFEEFGLITTSLFCHHLTDEEIIEMLIWMKKNAQTGVIINDLHRHPLAYGSIRLLTRLFSRSYLVKNDAPLSVLRGFRRKDWTRLMEKARITNYRIQWIWAFRWLVIIDNRCSGGNTDPSDRG